MTSKRKPTRARTKVVKAWAVYSLPHNDLCLRHARGIETLAVFETKKMALAWLSPCREGYRIVRVLISIAPTKGKRR